VFKNVHLFYFALYLSRSFLYSSAIKRKLLIIKYKLKIKNISNLFPGYETLQRRRNLLQRILLRNIHTQCINIICVKLLQRPLKAIIKSWALIINFNQILTRLLGVIFVIDIKTGLIN
jgi:hypothetical protein